MKSVAETLLAHPERIPSSEAAHAALLFASVGWNRAIGATEGLIPYEKLLTEFEKSNPKLWRELTSTDPDQMIADAFQYKQENHPDDPRRILVCGMRNGNVHVEWTEK